MVVKKQKTTKKDNKPKKVSGWMEPNDCRYQNKYRYFQEQCFLTELWAAGKFDNYKTEVVNDSTLDGLLDTPSLPTFSTPEKKETIELQIDKKKLHGYENFTILETSEHKEILKYYTIVQLNSLVITITLLK